MDLGLEGKKAIVCASSRGLGKACAISLAREGVHVVINGRNEETLTTAEAEIVAIGAGGVTAVVADLNSESGRSDLIAACPDADILVNNNDGPPPGMFNNWGRDDFQAALNRSVRNLLGLNPSSPGASYPNANFEPVKQAGCPVFLPVARQNILPNKQRPCWA